MYSEVGLGMDVVVEVEVEVVVSVAGAVPTVRMVTRAGAAVWEAAGQQLQ